MTILHGMVAAGTVLAATLSASAGSLEIQPVADDVFALVGGKEQRSPNNLANNATFGLVVTDDGLVLIDPGGSRKGAAAIDAAIQTISDKPVRYVIDTGGQDHRWLGNGYWKDKGATIIASADAVADQKERQSMQFTMLDALIGDALEGTEPAYADVVFDDDYVFSLGGLEFEIVHPGAAHTPGDSFVWLASRDTVFAGDIVFTERILGVLEMSSSSGWLESFDSLAAREPEHVVPGHGHATTLAKAKADTRDYIANLRERIGEHIDAGGDMITSVEVDQSTFSYLEQFDALARRNAQQVFSEMEWE
ncbi:MBL fold metallo-hydrolase [Oricola indica]|uniref:MBL fold metallo-hydrolase n=1 Tax=Oricola indica TaxID=2872591 RepID=UPI003CCBD20D